MELCDLRTAPKSELSWEDKQLPQGEPAESCPRTRGTACCVNPAGSQQPHNAGGSKSHALFPARSRAARATARFPC